jgi:DNA-binding CsgD family transcriptional regulator
VLRALGVESETDLAYSGLLELLRPVLNRISALPLGQEVALSGALAVGAAPDVDRFAVYAATLALIASVAEDQPVLCLVDDAQWLDRTSAEALLFATRRFAEEGVVMMFGARDGEATRFEARGVPELLLEGLDPADARRLLGQAPGGDTVAAEVAARLVTMTDGNPLALTEIPSELTEAQRVGAEALDDPLHGGAAVERAFGNRVSKLSPLARCALLLAAASDTGDLEPVLRAAGDDAAGLDEAQEVGLIRVDGGQIVFRHPLVRSAVYGSATAGKRRAVHSALADALTGTEPDRAAWHRALATVGFDEDVAAELVGAAEAARRRGGADSQARLLERAARLTPDLERRADRLLEAGRAAYHAGRADQAAALLDEGLELSSDPGVRADLVEVRTEVARAGGDIESWITRCRAEADLVEPFDRARASNLLFQVWDYVAEQFDCTTGRELIDRLAALAEPAGEEQRILSARAWQALLDGRTAEARESALRGAELSYRDPTERATEFGYVLGYIGEYLAARRLLEYVIGCFRRDGAILDLAKANTALCCLEVSMGRFTHARVAAAEAVDLAEEAGLVYWLTDALSCLAMAEATLGAEASCRAHAMRSGDLALRVGLPSTYAFTQSALGRLELGLGRTGEAIAALELARAAAADIRSPGFMLWMPDLIEAYVRAGRRRDALALCDIFDADAQAADHEWSLITVARCRALLAEAEFDEGFSAALALSSVETWPFERARCELLYGERLRRARRRVDAREELRRALECFERLGTSAFAERARGELRATGETVQGRDRAAVDDLTAQELQIALLVAEGRTNREVAAGIFLSPKTIEKHLSSVYRKLGLRSRSELARRFAER